MVLDDVCLINWILMHCGFVFGTGFGSGGS